MQQAGPSAPTHVVRAAGASAATSERARGARSLVFDFRMCAFLGLLALVVGLLPNIAAHIRRLDAVRPRAEAHIAVRVCWQGEPVKTIGGPQKLHTLKL